MAKDVMSAEEAPAHRLIQEALPAYLVPITGPEELEGMRRRLLAQPAPTGTVLNRRDYIASIGIFLFVVLATFPVVVPFMLTNDSAIAMRASQLIALAMLFVAGFVLGRYAGHLRPVLTGVYMALLGFALMAAVRALGG